MVVRPGIRVELAAAEPLIHDPVAARSVLSALVERGLRCTDPISTRSGRRRVVALVGPTGVGKTTTIAKLAANFRLRDGIKMGLVTVDTYRIAAVDHAGNVGDYSETVEATVLSIDGADIPEVFALHQNYPNPFNPSTQISYDLPEDAMVKITIFDVMGRSVKSLVNKDQLAGYRSVKWDATNNVGETVSAGMYIYTIQAGEFNQTRKMILLK